MHDSKDSGLTDSELAGYRVLAAARSMRRANCADIICCQFPGMHDHAVAFTPCLPPLGNLIRLIFGVRSGKDVCRIATERDITGMASEQLGRHRTVDQLPRKTVGRDALTMRNAELAVSVLIPTSQPRPTRIRPAAPVNLRPESFLGRDRLKAAGRLRSLSGSVITGRGTVAGCSSSASAITDKGGAATFARGFDLCGKLRAHLKVLSWVPRPGALTRRPVIRCPNYTVFAGNWGPA